MANPKVTISLWDWDNAPDWIKERFGLGGDEEGAVWVPKGGSLPWWVEHLWYDWGVTITELSQGTLYVWAHA